MPQTLLYLSQHDVIQCGGLDMARTLARVEEVFRLMARGECVEAEAPGLRWQNVRRQGMSLHPAYVGGSIQKAGVKWMTHFLDNATQHGLPNSLGLIILNDTETGAPLAIMDGALLSAMRTGAAAGVGAKHLARPDSEIVGLLGAGVINRAQLMAICSVMPQIRQVRLFSRTRAKADQFAAQLSEQLDVDIMVVDSARAAVTEADIIAPATTVGPHDQYIEADWIQPGAYLANLSGNDYTADAMLQCERIVIDHRKQLHLPRLLLAHLVAAGRVDATALVAMSAIVNGDHAGRLHADERILFCPDGLGAADVSGAHAIYKEALRQGVGQELTLWQEPHWV